MYTVHGVLVYQILLLKQMKDPNAKDYGHHLIYKEELDHFLFHMRLYGRLHDLVGSIQL